MSSEQFKTVFEDAYHKLSGSIINQLNETYGQEFKLEYLLPENSDQVREMLADEFPLVTITLQATDTTASHVIGLSLSAVSRFLAWAAGTSPKEELEEEDMDVFSQQVTAILQALPEWESGQPEFAFVESAEKFVTDNDPDYAVYELVSGEESFKIFHVIRGLELEKETTKEGVAVHPADFGKVPETPAPSGVVQNMDMLLDVELRVFVELGQKSMLINDILKLGKGSVIELEKAAGEPLDIFVNDKKFAMGEVVVVDDRFGIRITKLAGLNTKLGSIAS